MGVPMLLPSLKFFTTFTPSFSHRPAKVEEWEGERPEWVKVEVREAGVMEE
eukprot:CAMPEP_0118656916 /NCGR_PEP_ID=MMETSP0785-20121206/13734_1 /TAXON_ID=91992 /ORGANISM="Bolidomonas pacifica, Strain CCMP 1866" /LENGTH=50 /DNA_ID=CAMNT_0006549787 /DNA_START=132 /DNA_END=284 /DNA_ORIENTATION=-